jgi:hypothetical protein
VLFPTMAPPDIQQHQQQPLLPPQSAPLVSYQFQEPLNSFEFANLNLGQVLEGEGEGGDEVDIGGIYNFYSLPPFLILKDDSIVVFEIVINLHKRSRCRLIK